jgi:hypothetical protein
MSRYSQPIEVETPNLNVTTNYNTADQINQVPYYSAGEAGLMVDPAVNLEITIPYFTETASPADEVDVTSPVKSDEPGNKYTTDKKAWGTNNADALMVFERASSDFTAGIISINTQNGNTAIVVGRQKGRKSVTIWVPSTYTNSSGSSSTPNGVMIAQTEGEVQAYAAVQLNPGDSITINTEAPIWAGVLPGASTGICQYIVEYNPAGGELGGQ